MFYRPAVLAHYGYDTIVVGREVSSKVECPGQILRDRVVTPKCPRIIKISTTPTRVGKVANGYLVEPRKNKVKHCKRTLRSTNSHSRNSFDFNLI